MKLLLIGVLFSFNLFAKDCPQLGMSILGQLNSQRVFIEFEQDVLVGSAGKYVYICNDQLVVDLKTAADSSKRFVFKKGRKIEVAGPIKRVDGLFVKFAVPGDKLVKSVHEADLAPRNRSIAQLNTCTDIKIVCEDPEIIEASIKKSKTNDDSGLKNVPSDEGIASKKPKKSSGVKQDRAI